MEVALLTAPTIPASIGDSLASADEIWAYLLVFLFSATPWLEILLVIPPAIALGLDPVTVTALAFLGNLLTVCLVIVFHERIAAWWRGRRDDDVATSSKRYRRARRLFDDYGVPVVALAAPLVTGSHLGAVLALLFGASTRAVVWWMTISLLAWSVGLAMVSVAGLSLLGLA